MSKNGERNTRGCQEYHYSVGTCVRMHLSILLHLCETKKYLFIETTLIILLKLAFQLQGRIREEITLCNKEIPCIWQRLRKTQRHLLVWILKYILSFDAAKGFYHATHTGFGQTVRSPLLATAHWENISRTKEPLAYSKEPDWRSSVPTQHKSPTPLVLPRSHSWLSLLDRGEHEAPALAPARHSPAQLCPLCSATSHLHWPQGSHGSAPQSSEG